MPNDPNEQKKSELIAGLVSARRRIMALVADLPPDKREVIFLGEWSVVDLVAHLIGWDYTNLAAAKEILAGRVPSFFAFRDRDWKSYNAQLVREHKVADFGVLLERAEESHRRLIDYLQALPADDLTADHGVRRNNRHVLISRLLAAEASDEETHADQLARWMEST